MAIDRVAHGGTTTAGSYACTLAVIDIATGWTEFMASATTGQQAVRTALAQVRARFPFPWHGIACDNGAEFLNAHLLRDGQQEHLTLTRWRTYHKNDQAHGAQKNWSVVRQLVGYERSASPAAVAALNALYSLLRVDVHGYPPVMKLVGKERLGARVRKQALRWAPDPVSAGGAGWRGCAGGPGGGLFNDN